MQEARQGGKDKTRRGGTLYPKAVSFLVRIRAGNEMLAPAGHLLGGPQAGRGVPVAVFQVYTSLSHICMHFRPRRTLEQTP